MRTHGASVVVVVFVIPLLAAQVGDSEPSPGRRAPLAMRPGVTVTLTGPDARSVVTTLAANSRSLACDPGTTTIIRHVGFRSVKRFDRGNSRWASTHHDRVVSGCSARNDCWYCRHPVIGARTTRQGLSLCWKASLEAFMEALSGCCRRLPRCAVVAQNSVIRSPAPKRASSISSPTTPSRNSFVASTQTHSRRSLSMSTRRRPWRPAVFNDGTARRRQAAGGTASRLVFAPIRLSQPAVRRHSRSWLTAARGIRHRLALIGLQGRPLQHRRPSATGVSHRRVGFDDAVDKLPLMRADAHAHRRSRRRDRVAIVDSKARERTGAVEPPLIRAHSPRWRRQAGGSTNGASDQAGVSGRTLPSGGVDRVVLFLAGDFNIGVTNEANWFVDRTGAKRSCASAMSSLKDSTMEKLADKGAQQLLMPDAFRFV